MLSPKIESALNAQLNLEQSAAHAYLSLAAYFESDNLKGFARFMCHQAQEEREHAMRIFAYIAERGGTIRLDAIPGPAADFGSPRAAFEAAFDRERKNTQSIHQLYRLARDEDDHATQTMLHWFIEEQVEEEAWCAEALALLERIGDNQSALIMLDTRYGKQAEA